MAGREIVVGVYVRVLDTNKCQDWEEVECAPEIKVIPVAEGDDEYLALVMQLQWMGVGWSEIESIVNGVSDIYAKIDEIGKEVAHG